MSKMEKILEEVKENNIISWNCNGRQYDLTEIQNDINFIVDNDKNLSYKDKLKFLDITSEFIQFIEIFGEE